MISFSSNALCAADTPWGAGGVAGPDAIGGRLREGWRRASSADGVFRYRVCVREQQARVLPGRYRYLLQLNLERSSKRRQPAHIENVQQEFDSAAFNFCQVSPEEVLLHIRDTDRDAEEAHCVLVNVSPISEYHSLLCPSLRSCLPQVITLDSLTLVLQLMFRIGDRDVRLGFNSLCALASVNHLHYHILLESSTLPVEHVKCRHLSGPLYCLVEDYPARGFCFQVKSAGETEAAGRDVFRLVRYLLDESVAHNVLVTRGASAGGAEGEVLRVLVWARRSCCGAKQPDAFNVAVCELAGWFPVYNEEAYRSLQACDVERALRGWTADTFSSIQRAVTRLYTST